MTLRVSFALCLILSAATPLPVRGAPARGAPDRGADERPELVIWHAAWCGPCRRLMHDYRWLRGFGPTLDRHFRVRWVDFDRHAAEAKKAGIEQVPAFVTRGGTIYGYSGAMPLLRELAALSGRNRANDPGCADPGATQPPGKAATDDPPPTRAPPAEDPQPVPALPEPRRLQTLEEDLDHLRRQMAEREHACAESHAELLAGMRQSLDDSLARLPRPQPLEPLVEELRRQGEQNRQALEQMRAETARVTRLPAAAVDREPAGKDAGLNWLGLLPAVLTIASGAGGAGLVGWLASRALGRVAGRILERVERPPGDGGLHGMPHAGQGDPQQVPFPRKLDEAGQLLELGQLDGRVPVLDALRGMFLDDERQKIDAGEDEKAKQVLQEVIDSIDDRIDQVAPLSVKADAS